MKAEENVHVYACESVLASVCVNVYMCSGGCERGKTNALEVRPQLRYSPFFEPNVYT